MSAHTDRDQRTHGRSTRNSAAARTEMNSAGRETCHTGRKETIIKLSIALCSDAKIVIIHTMRNNVRTGWVQCFGCAAEIQQRSEIIAGQP
jgi:hypothetical protein